jgi:ribosome maturation factor RimP
VRQVPLKLDEIIEPTVVGMGYELVGIEYLPRGKHSVLRVYIDSDDGITVDDCARVSDQISGILDVEDPIHGHYSLEVSSPGLDRPLFTLEQFTRFSGQIVCIQLAISVDGRRKFTGVLRGVIDNQVYIEEHGLEILLPFDAIKKANLVAKL